MNRDSKARTGARSSGNATTHALRFAEAAARQFTADLDDLESGSKTATSVASFKNHLSDAQESLTEGEGGNRGALV